MIGHPGAVFCFVVFVISLVAVLFEERTHLRRSKPVLLGAGLIWVAIALMAPGFGVAQADMRTAVFHGLDEYASLVLFILTAMAYVAALQERQVFAALRSRLVRADLNMRELFWTTGFIAFLLAPVAGSMPTALVMGAIVMAVGANDPKFVTLSCINIVSAANAGGVFSPFGDVTTLMLWQAGKLELLDFFRLAAPALVCFIVPAVAMGAFVKEHKPLALGEVITIKRGGKVMIALGILTLLMTIGFEQFLGLPPFVGMMMGLSFLMVASYVVRHTGDVADRHFSVIDLITPAEWDTLLFFLGVIISVGGMAYVGYDALASHLLYDGAGAVTTHIAMGLGAALFDGVPVMLSVLTINPDLSSFQWLLITLTAGVGGSLLSIGSAAGIALMGIGRGQYSFMKHLQWTPILALGYIAAIAIHFLVNG